MKTLLFSLFALCTGVVMATPSISRPYKGYIHDKTKVSGLKPVACLGQLNGTNASLTVFTDEGAPGKKFIYPLIIDAPEGIKSFDIYKVDINKPDVTECPLSFSHIFPHEEGALSHMIAVTTTIPNEEMAATVTFRINGVDLLLTFVLVPKNEE